MAKEGEYPNASDLKLFLELRRAGLPQRCVSMSFSERA